MNEVTLAEKQILDKAEELISEPNKWIQGTLHHFDRHCAVGAVESAARNLYGHPESVSDALQGENLKQAIKHTCNQLKVEKDSERRKKLIGRAAALRIKLKLDNQARRRGHESIVNLNDQHYGGSSKSRLTIHERVMSCFRNVKNQKVYQEIEKR